jgi:hypothetical protein
MGLIVWGRSQDITIGAKPREVALGPGEPTLVTSALNNYITI